MTKATSNVAVIITAAGSSTRIGGGNKKEFLPYKNGTVLSASIKAFFKAAETTFNLTQFVITLPKNSFDNAQKAVSCDTEITPELFKKINFTEGGKSRQESVNNALEYIFENYTDTLPDYVLVHDGARPFVSPELITSVVHNTIQYEACIPGLQPTDTQKEIDEDGFIKRHLQRARLVAVQTPQGFVYKKLLQAHRQCSSIISQNNGISCETKNSITNIREFTDDAEIWGEYFDRIKVIAGESTNIKITYPSDLEKLK